MDDKNQYVSGLTVGPSCFIDGPRRRKQRFTLLNAALDMINRSPNEKTRKNKKSVKRTDDKINGNKNNNNGKNTKGWKQLVGSMRPLHMQASRSPSSSSSISSTNRYSSPTSSSISSTSRYSSPTNNPQELENMGTTMSTSVSPSNLQELVSPGSSGTMNSTSVSTDDLQEVEGTRSHSTASSNDFQQLPAPDNLQEVAGTMSPGVSANNLADLARAGSMRKHNISSSGNLGGLGRKGKMSSSKSTSNLQDLSSGMMRQYKSALNLHDLDLDEEMEADEEDSNDKLLENCAADGMIDAKADQFIKNFYQQIMNNQHKGKGRRNRN